MFEEYKGVSTSVELSTTNPIAFARVGKGTTLTFQHDIPEGFEVKISGTVANYREIPDATVDIARIEALRAKGVVAHFDEFDVIAGKGMHSVYGLAINGLKFELNQKKKAEPLPEDVAALEDLPEDAMEVDKLDWNALRNLAKSLGIPVKMGTKREEAEAAVIAKLTELSDPSSPAPVSVVAAGTVKTKIAFACK